LVCVEWSDAEDDDKKRVLNYNVDCDEMTIANVRAGMKNDKENNRRPTAHRRPRSAECSPEARRPHYDDALTMVPPPPVSPFVWTPVPLPPETSLSSPVSLIDETVSATEEVLSEPLPDIVVSAEEVILPEPLSEIAVSAEEVTLPEILPSAEEDSTVPQSADVPAENVSDFIPSFQEEPLKLNEVFGIDQDNFGLFDDSQQSLFPDCIDFEAAFP